MQRLARPVVHQINDRQISRDLGLGHPRQTVVNLMLKQVRGLVEQIDFDKPVGKTADDLIALAASRR
ncbi:MAG: hypothetical protein KDI98_06520, partial [Hyphomicrobiaceae bacterium]|nr:hypothetical protein [Hyphomicrobiaceae bacterium]